ncbi:DUF6221 family protein [Streptomyces pseudogriseolus]|uniref:DUF6221 family protein n=1 Tax=Streptomyces pseudogriseolus TaxID=36817 RepID=UPI003FA2F77F
MDLHAWIALRVDHVEALAKLATPGPWEGVVDHHQRGIAEVSVWAGNIGYYVAETITSGDRQEADGYHIGQHNPEAVLRRCEADRRILARHRHATEWDWALDAPCHGCGTEGDCDDPVTENLNDCPELLDLAHAHGITDDILASLDRPTPPELKRRPGPRLGLADLLAPRTPMGEVPGALRGPNWKPGAT